MDKGREIDSKNLFQLDLDKQMKLMIDLVRYGFIVLIGFLIISSLFSIFGPEKEGTDEKEDLVQDAISMSRIGSMIGFGMLGFGLLSIAFLSKDLHLYLRIAIVIAMAIILRSVVWF